MKTEKLKYPLFTDLGKRWEERREKSKDVLKKRETLKGSVNFRWPGFKKKHIKTDDRLCYDSYQLSWREWGIYGFLGIAACEAAAYIFYRNVAACILFLPFGMLYPLYRKRELMKQRKEELRVQFKEAVQILSSSLSAGYAIENAFTAGICELEELYGKRGMITREFSYIAGQLQNNRPVEQLLGDFAKRSGVEEIQSFADIFAVSKRSRGELTSVVGHVVRVISDKIQVRSDIMTMTAEKKLEQKIMNGMPFLIVIYIDLSSPGFFAQMYETVMGRIIMTACLAVYLGACILSNLIMKIDV